MVVTFTNPPPSADMVEWLGQRFHGKGAWRQAGTRSWIYEEA